MFRLGCSSLVLRERARRAGVFSSLALFVIGVSGGVSRAGADPLYAAPLSFSTGSDPYSVAIGDLNGDGKPDLVTANYDDSTISVLLGNGDGTFGLEADFGIGNGPTSVAIGDLNGDGKPDLIIANYVSNTVSMLLGNGDGTFGPKTDFGTGSGPYFVAIGDLNGDGKPDLATANRYSNTISVLLGNGDGTFGPKTDFGTGAQPVSVAIGDLNGDGKPDLAVANDGYHLGSNLSVLLNNGDGTFGAKTDYGTRNYPNSIAIGDLNGDGKPDLAVAATGYPYSVSVLLNNGDGTFGPWTEFGTGNSPSSSPFSVVIGDLNGDGKLDLAVAHYYHSTISVLLGNGDGTFGSWTDFGTGNPNSMAIEDLNGDGKPDLAVVNYGFHTVSVLLNNGGDCTTRAITASAGPNGSIAPIGNVSVACGASQTFTITPSSCYSVADVLVDGASVGAVTSYTFTNVTGYHSIAARFALTNPTGLPAPTGVAIFAAQDNTALTVAWSQVPGAVSYHVQRTGGTMPAGPWTVTDGPFPQYRDAEVVESVEYTYTVSAENACHVVGPASESEPKTIHYPVVFVHGICGKPADWATWGSVFRANGLTDLQSVDLRRGAPDNPKPNSANQPIDVSAKLLQGMVESIPGKVNIVAHSMGGIVARQYIQAHGGGAKVNKLVMMGSPNHGMGGERAINELLGWGLSPFVSLFRCLTWGEADDQLQVNSPFLRELNYGVYEHVKDHQCPEDRASNGPEQIASYADRCWTIAGTGNQTGLVCQAVNKRAETWQCSTLDRTNDGFVSVGSGHLDALSSDPNPPPVGQPRNWHLEHNLIDFDLVGEHLYHASPLSLAWPPTLVNCSDDYLSSSLLATQVVHLLMNQEFSPVSSQPLLAQSRARPDRAQSADSLGAVDLPYENFTQRVGEVIESPVVMPSTPEASFFCLTSRPGEMAFRLKTPSGVVVSATDTTGRQDLVYRSEPENGIQFFVVSNPEAGTWHLITDAGAAIDSQFVGLISQIRSKASIEAVMDTVVAGGIPQLRITGMPMQSGALVQDATLQADVVSPQGGVQTVNLYDDGAHGDGAATDGVYGALFAPFGGNGVYGADVRASWSDSEQTTQRATSTSYGIAAPIDLALDSLGIVPSIPVPDSGLTITLSVKLRNLGSQVADSATVNWYQLGVGQFGQSTATVPPNDSVTVSTPWLAAGGDTVSVFAIALVGPGQSETSYANNVARSSIVLGPPPVTAVAPQPLSLPRVFRVLPVRPNPSRSDAVIEFDLPEKRRVDVQIFDVAGRRVATLASDLSMVPGRHALHWDGRDNGGARAESGVFFVRVRAGRDRQTRSLVLLR